MEKVPVHYFDIKLRRSGDKVSCQDYSHITMAVLDQLTPNGFIQLFDSQPNNQEKGRQVSALRKVLMFIGYRLSFFSATPLVGSRLIIFGIKVHFLLTFSSQYYLI